MIFTKGMRQVCIAGALAMGAAQAYAGGFVTLPSTGADIRVVGSNNQLTDQLFLGDGWTPGANGYSFVTARDVQFFTDDDLIGTFSDAVYRKASDNSLMFATRVVLNEEEDDTELNLIWRSGFNGFTTAASWYREIDTDFRAQATASTANVFRANITNPVNMLSALGNYNPDVVGFRRDVSVDEGAPTSGWYVIQTNATNYSLLDDAALFRQLGSESEMRDPVDWSLAAYAPTAAVPEPSEYAMLAVGLTFLGFVVQRRRRCAAG